MNSKIKRLIVGLVVVSALLVYPLSSTGRASDHNRIVLTSDNTVNLNGEIDDQSVATTIQALQKLDSKYKSNKPIYLFIYSPGGSIQAGLELIEAAKGLNRPVNTITMFGASMAFQTVQNLGQRLILKNGVLMSHRAAGEFQGYFGGQTPSQLDSRYGFWVQRTKELDEQTVKRTNGKQTMASYQKQYSEETWLTGSQSVEEGYADNVVTVRCDNSLNGTETKTGNFMGIEFTYEISNCPLITAPLNVKISDKAKNDPRLIEEIRSKFIDSFDLFKMVQ